MENLYVDISHEMGSITIGRSNLRETSSKNLQIIYGKDLYDIFRDDTFKNGVSRFFDKYCQFIISVETSLIPHFSIIMTFIDCHDNIDTALEFFTVSGTSLKYEEKVRFMDLFNEILDNKGIERVQMKYSGL